jgi:citrate lyase synthetase
MAHLDRATNGGHQFHSVMKCISLDLAVNGRAMMAKLTRHLVDQNLCRQRHADLFQHSQEFEDHPIRMLGAAMQTPVMISPPTDRFTLGFEEGVKRFGWE